MYFLTSDEALNINGVNVPVDQVPMDPWSRSVIAFLSSLHPLKQGQQRLLDFRLIGIITFRRIVVILRLLPARRDGLLGQTGSLNCRTASSLGAGGISKSVTASDLSVTEKRERGGGGGVGGGGGGGGGAFD